MRCLKAFGERIAARVPDRQTAAFSRSSEVGPAARVGDEARRRDQQVRIEERALILIDGLPRAIQSLVPHGAAPRSGAGEVEEELLLHLALPLPHQRCRRSHEDAMDLPRKEQGAERKPSLDGLAEPHLVAHHLAERPGLGDAPGDEALVGPGLRGRRLDPDEMTVR